MLKETVTRKFVKSLPREVKDQIVKDYVLFEETGCTGDTILRKYSLELTSLLNKPFSITDMCLLTMAIYEEAYHAAH